MAQEPNGSRLQPLVRTKIVCHPRVMSRRLPHLTLTTSTSSLSTTSPIIPSSSPTLPDLLTHDPYLPCEDSRRSGGTKKFPSPAGYEPKRTEHDRNLEVGHQDLSIMGDDYQNPPITEDVDEFEKTGVKSLSCIQSQMHSDYDSVEKHCRLGPRRWTIAKNAGFTAVYTGATRKL